MGNTYVGPSISKNGFLQSVSATIWRSPRAEASGSITNAETVHNETPTSIFPIFDKLPQYITMPKPIPKIPQELDEWSPKKPTHVKRVSRAGLRTESVLLKKTGKLKDFFNLGRKLGQRQFGITFLCLDKATGKDYACKSIAKRKLLTDEDVEDVRRKIQIMYHLAGHPNVISIKGLMKMQ